ncbi:D-glycerate 3- chloroplastic [Chlorella sorokiniana]|uniref:D-glycerate 3-chloroplastic n=1 Tax=Chlorella sorokiniana TaxID=3076 RepID=A0A2P6TZ30_CHLSO|nr:D-glycerate 3- chloroplastic [Chlorella sorokiniana]|eukprot:PRW59300.1 D-glycerate 3- chloroplastic [Chlorella sorokiniana]
MITGISALLHKQLGGGKPAATAAAAANGVATQPTQLPAAAAPVVANGSQHSADKELVDFICASPLLTSCGIDRAQVEAEAARWLELGSRVISSLGLQPFGQLLPAQKRRIFQYYLPVFFWCEAQLRQHRGQPGTSGPLVLGISAPQGCGKTTLCEQLQSLFEYTGASAASISIDDFYLTYQGQQEVATANPGNPLLQMRGNAGSHDMGLGTDTLQALKAATRAGSSVPIPRYDKSAYSGKGDRADASTWPQAQGPVDVVLCEGWMLGFAPVSDAAAAASDANLVAVNAALRSYKTAWDSFVDSWLVVKVAQPDYAYRWRLQAEQAMRATGKPAMTDEQVAAFVDRFMPAYRCYLPGLYSEGPTTARPGHLLVVEVDEGREPVEQQPAPIM